MAKVKVKKIKDKKKKEGSEKEFSEFFKGHHKDVKEKDMSKIERAPINRRRNILIFVFIILALILAASLLGFYFFTQENKYSGEGVNVEIDVPEKIASGDEISLDILISNYEATDLKLSQLTMRFPEGFKFSSAQPSADNEFNNAWELGTLESGQETRVTVRGQLLGEVDSAKVFLATLNYVPSNFNSEFQKTTSQTVTISTSIIELKVASPDGAVDQQDIEFKISYKNTSDEELSSVRLRINYPDDFTFSQSDPEARTGTNNIWQSDFLGEQEEVEVTVKGKIEGAVGDIKEIKAEIGIMKADGTFSLQTESYALINIIEPASGLELTVNGNYDDSVIQWEGTLDYLIKFKNNGQVVLNDIQLSVSWKQAPEVILDKETVVDVNEGTITDGGITWSGEQIENLSVVRPGDEIEIGFQINTKAYTDMILDEEDINFSITNMAQAESASLLDTGDIYLQESNEIVNKVASQVTLNTEGRYYDDEFDKIGAGPLPPEVSSKTTYKVFWNISNSSNSLEDITITAVLPQNAEWEGNSVVSPKGTLTYDPKTKTVTWQISQLDAHVGNLTPEAQASFHVSVLPQKGDVGKLMVITEGAQLIADDTFANEEVIKNDGVIDTNLDNDVAAQDKGIVVNRIEKTNSNLNTNINTNTNTNINTNTNSNQNTNS
ncbi:MAG: hypothetical protein ABIB97_05280 [Patescibacteria group bacterium]